MRRFSLIAALVAFCFSPAHGAELDPLELGLDQAFPMQMRWHAIGSGRRVVGGVSPTGGLIKGFPLLELGAGQESRLWVDAGAVLRLHRPEGWENAGPLTVSLSQGTGLFLEVNPEPTDDPRDLLVRVPWEGAAVLRLQRPEMTGQEVTFAVFERTFVPRPNVVPFREQLRFPGVEEVEIEDRGRTAGDWVRLDPGQTLSAPLGGAADLRIETRVIYGQRDSDWRRRYRLDVAVDGEPLERFDTTAPPSQNGSVFVAGEAAVLGEVRPDHISLPAGHGTLTLKSDRALYVRVLWRKAPDTLLTEINGPKLQAPADITPWEQLEAEARDPMLEGAGLAVLAKARAMARAHPDLPVLSNRADEIRRVYTRFAPLVPASPASQRMVKLSHPSLLGPGMRRRPFHITKPQARDLFERSPFFPLIEGQGEETGVSFDLPERSAWSLLRFSLPMESLREGEVLWVEVDGAPLTRLEVASLSDLPERSLQEPLASAMVHLGGEGVVGGAEIPLQAASVEIPVARDAKWAVVYRNDGQALPPFALSLLVSATPRPDEAVYMQAVWTLADGGVLPKVLAELNACPAGRRVAACLVEDKPRLSPSEALVRRSLLPALRRIRTRALVFADGVVPWPAPEVPAGVKPDREAAKLLAERGLWSAALESWRAVEAKGNKADRLPALAGQVQALRGLGQHGMVRRMLQSLASHGGDGELRAWAYSALAHYLGQVMDSGGQRRTEAAWALASPGDPAAVTALLSGFIEEAQFSDAVLLGLVALPDWRPSEDLSFAAHDMGWYKARDAFAGSALAQAVEALDGGFVPEGAWGQAALAARDISQVLRQGDGGGVMQLASWWENLPGPRVWRDASDLIRRHRGIAEVFNPALGLSFTAARAGVGEDLILKAAGPGRLRLTLRPLHEVADGQLMEQQVRLKAGKKTLWLPILDNAPSQGLSLADGSVPGESSITLLDLPEGMNEIALRPDRGTVLVQVERFGPVTGLSLLPTVAENFVQPVLGPHAVAEVERGLLRADPLAYVEGGGAKASPALSLYMAEAERANVLGKGRRRIGAFYHDFAAGGEGEEQAFLEAGIIALEHPDDPEVQRIWDIMFRRAGAWEPLRSVDKSAGIWRSEIAGWSPESDEGRVLRTYLAGLRGDEMILQGGGTLYADVDLDASAVVRVKAVSLNPPGGLGEPLSLTVGVEGQREVSKAMEPGATETVTVHVPAGSNTVKIALPDAILGRAVAVRLEENGVPLSTARDRLFHVGTEAEPVQVMVAGPTILRVNEWRDGRLLTLASAVPGGDKPASLTLTPPPGHPEIVIRLARLIYQQGKAVASLPVRAKTQPAPVAIAQSVLGDAEPPKDTLPVNNNLDLPDQEGGTWSFGFDLRRRTVNDTDSSLPAGATEFVKELTAAYRLHDLDNLRYYLAEVTLRQPEQDDRTMIAMGRIDQQLDEMFGPSFPSLPMIASASLTLAAQDPGTISPAWLGQFDGRISYSDPLTLKLQQSVAASVFARYLSLGKNEAGSARIDPAVYSIYKSDHQHGMGLSYRLEYSPMLDNLMWGGLGLSTNENWNPVSPDYIDLQVGFAQMLGDAVLDYRQRVRRYRADGDRTKGRTKHDGLMRLYWDIFDEETKRLEMGLDLGRDFTDDAWTGLFGLTWHFGNGRRYEDFRPSETPFRDLREYREFPQ